MVVLMAVATVIATVSSVPDKADAAADPAPGTSVQTTESQALRAARKDGKPVEVAALRGESREVYANSDGSFTATEHLRPVRTRKDGSWRNIDTSLRVQADRSVAPVASSVDLSFSAGGTGPMARMARAGRLLALTWPGSLPPPVLDGDTAVYAEVLPGVDLRLKAEVDGMSQLLVVKTAQAAQNPALARLAFTLGGSGLRVEPDASGGLLAVDAVSGGSVFSASTPLMWDSSTPAVQPATAAQTPAEDPADGPADGAKVAEVKASCRGRR